MGYSTSFTGVLKFTSEPTTPQLKLLGTILGEDPSDHAEWVHHSVGNVSYIQLEVARDYSGLQWDGTEKFYEAVNAVNLVLAVMREEFPDFGLSGELTAQGEDNDDRWRLVIGDDGRAKKVDVPLTGRKVICPHCRETFRLDD